MLTPEAIAAFNGRLTDLHRLEHFSPVMRQRVIDWAQRASELLQNPDFAQFVHQYKFELCDQLSTISQYTADAERQRLHLAQQIAGIQGFVDMLHTAVHHGQRAGNLTRTRLDKKGDINE